MWVENKSHQIEDVFLIIKDSPTDNNKTSYILNDIRNYTAIDNQEIIF